MGGWWVRGGISRTSLGTAGSHDLRIPDHETEFTSFYPLFFFRPLAFRTCSLDRVAASPVHSAYRAFFAIRVFLLSLGSALVFFDGVSVGTGITSVSLSVAYSPRIRGIRVWSSCWMDGMTTRVRNLRCCVACHCALSLGSGRF